jgi:CO/xanthine dehydrogenase Mo-binding subunit
MENDGSVSVVLGTVDLTGSDTSMTLIAAEALGVPAARVNVVHENTDSMPYSGGTGGSKTIYSMGPAVIAAAQDARRQILEVASDLLEAAVDDLDIENGNVVVKGVPGRSLSLEKVAQASTNFSSSFGPIYGHGRVSNSENSPMYTAHAARVAVDPETGEVRVLAYVAAQDVGRAINPASVEGQIHGGVTQGLGWALYEGFEYDEHGQLLTSTLMDYALPYSFEVPEITTLFVEIPSGPGPYGAKGVGEPPVIPVAATIANAIHDAVGVRPAEIPITSERLFTALQRKA